MSCKAASLATNRYLVAMDWWLAAIWGAAGGALIEATDLYRAIRRVGGYPWREKDEPPLGPYLLSVVLRIGVGAALAAAMGATGQATTPLGTLIVGVSAPLLLERISRVVPIEAATPSPATRAFDVPEPDTPTHHLNGADSSNAQAEPLAREPQGVGDDAG